jgi:hypothetical protein
MMVDWTAPASFEIAALHEALLFAYPKRQDFARFLFFSLGESYDQVAPGEGYANDLLAVLLLARGAGWLQRLVQKALQDKPASPKLLVLKRSLALAPVAEAHAVARNLEDIVKGGSQFPDLIPWIEKLGQLGARTCRIEYPLNSAVGSGWLVGPDLVLTNWHVIEQALPGGARQAADYVCRFDYAVTAHGVQDGVAARLAGDWCMDASPPSPAELGNGTGAATVDTLDHALIRLDRPVGDGPSPLAGRRGWIELSGSESVPGDEAIVMVLQYPDGLPLKLAIGEVSGGATDVPRFFHTANTKGGSSGALVVDAGLAPVGLHHAGDLAYHRGHLGSPERNQAVPIGRIARRLRDVGHLY